jgi:hypothetical protein
MTGIPLQVLSMALVSGAGLTTVAVSLLTLSRAWSLLRQAERTTSMGGSRADAVVGVLQQKLDELERQIDELRRDVSATPIATNAPRAGLNLDKRSHALRMHRRGEGPAEIAAALGIPQQEVLLLLKVHRVVLSSI